MEVAKKINVYIVIVRGFTQLHTKYFKLNLYLKNSLELYLLCQPKEERDIVFPRIIYCIILVILGN